MPRPLAGDVVFARLARWCHRRRRLVALAWLAVLVLGFTLGGSVFGRLGGAGEGGDGWESARGYQRLQEVSPYGVRLAAVVDTPTGRDAEAVRAEVERARTDLAAQDGIARVVDGFAAPAPQLRSVDGRAALITVDLVKDLDQERHDELVDAVERRLREVGAAAPAEVTLGGAPLLRREFNEQTEQDTRLGEFVALPSTLVVMVFVFGGLAAAGVPFLGAVASVAGGLLSLLGFSYVLDDLDPSVVSVTTVLGLGLSIDYALLIVSRYREERAQGHDLAVAVERAGATAGRTITFSALTVAVSLAGLFAFPTPIFRAIAAAGVSVVLVALLAGLTLAPALIGLFGGRLRLPPRHAVESRIFARLALAVQRRAVLVVLLVGGLLLGAGVPFLHASFRNGGADLLPPDKESRRFLDLQKTRFPVRGAEPVTVVAAGTGAQVTAYADRVRQLPGVADVRPPTPLGEVSVLEVVPEGDGQGPAAQQLVRDLRADRGGLGTSVTGDAAVLVDFKDEVRSRIPAALAVVVVATFVLLFLMTGSVLVPVKALVMNTLSLGASFGVLVWGFQDGHLAGLLGFTPTGGLETWVPVIGFAFAFGLSMDYEVFLLSRVKECYDAGLDNDAAVVAGLHRSGRIITLAAALMCIVFAGFSGGGMLGIKQLGSMLFLAVLVDATLVRCLLVPATMTLLGDRNWWAPAPLRRLHDRFGMSEHSGPGRPRGVPAAGEQVLAGS